MNAQELNLNDLIKVKFPSLNKNGEIADNQARIAECFNVNVCRITKILDVAPAEFDLIANSYLSDQPGLWEGIGGSELAPAAVAEFNALALANGIDPDGEMAPFQDSLRGFYRANCQVRVVLLRAPGRPAQFINSEGYAYARYVGEALDIPEMPPCCCCGEPAVNGVMDAKLGLRYACAEHYWRVREEADLHYNQANNVVDVDQRDLYEPGLSSVVLARKVKAQLRKLNPQAKWSVKADGYGRVQAELVALPPGMKIMAAPDEASWAFVKQQEGGCVFGEKRDWDPAFGRFMENAEIEADRFNRWTMNSHLQGLDTEAYRIDVGVNWKAYQGQPVAA